jgi:8-oxo-dGTP pyrophosphatase MutT (NUDIX family)
MKTRRRYPRLLNFLTLTWFIAYIQKRLGTESPKPTKIVHLFLVTYKGEILLFRRSCLRWAPVAGKIERNETPGEAAFREVREETGVTLKDNIFASPFTFEGRSPKGKSISGQAHFAFLGKEFCLSEIKLKLDELVEYQVLPPDAALHLLAQQGFPEGYAGLNYILNHIPIAEIFSSFAVKESIRRQTND